MSYHDGSQIPNYWAYARNFVLQDHMFEPNWGWSLPAHLWLVSGWSAQCRNPYQREHVHDESRHEERRARGAASPPPARAAVRLDRPHLPPAQVPDHVGLVRPEGRGARLPRGPIRCYTRLKGGSAPRMWNPLPDFTDVREDHQRDISQEPLRRFYSAAERGNLPNVSWVTPDWADSNHPGAPIGQGQAWVTRLVNAVMAGPDWKSTAIFLAWDDWGGFYDHVAAAGRRPQRLRASGAGHRDQPLREARLRRPPDPQLRRLPQVHRGRLPRRPSPEPEDGRAARPPSRRPREREGPRRPPQGLRLRPEGRGGRCCPRTAGASRSG